MARLLALSNLCGARYQPIGSRKSGGRGGGGEGGKAASERDGCSKREDEGQRRHIRQVVVVLW